MDEETRAQYEGFRPGVYVRLQISNMPCEFVTNFNATYPVVLGSLLSAEQNIGYVQVMGNLYSSWCLTHWPLGDVAVISNVEHFLLNFPHMNAQAPSDAYMCHQPRQSLVQIMACRLTSDKP